MFIYSINSKLDLEKKLVYLRNKLHFCHSYRGLPQNDFLRCARKKYFLKWVMSVLYNILLDIDLEGQSYGPGRKYVSKTAQHYVCVRKGLIKSIHARPFLGVCLCTLSLRPKMLSKGQFFSKGLIGILGFSQKTNERIRF